MMKSKEEILAALDTIIGEVTKGDLQSALASFSAFHKGLKPKYRFGFFKRAANIISGLKRQQKDDSLGLLRAYREKLAAALA